MKFIVRKGFVLLIPAQLDPETNEVVEGARTVIGGQGIDLDEDAARAHAHKLEPTDKTAAGFLEDLHVDVSAPNDPLVTAVAAGVAQALQQLGLVAPKAPPAKAPATPPAGAQS